MTHHTIPKTIPHTMLCLSVTHFWSSIKWILEVISKKTRLKYIRVYLLSVIYMPLNSHGKKKKTKCKIKKTNCIFSLFFYVAMV